MQGGVPSAGVLLIDERVGRYADRLAGLRSFIERWRREHGVPLYGLLLRAEAPIPEEVDGYLGGEVEVLGSVGPGIGGRGAVGWASGVACLLTRLGVGRGLSLGVWYCIESREAGMCPYELLHWTLYFSGFYIVFARRVVYAGGRYMECPSQFHSGGGLDRYRDLLAAALILLERKREGTPYSLAKAMADAKICGLSAVDALRKRLSKALSESFRYSLTRAHGEGWLRLYSLSEFGEALVGILADPHVLQHLPGWAGDLAFRS